MAHMETTSTDTLMSIRITTRAGDVLTIDEEGQWSADDPRLVAAARRVPADDAEAYKKDPVLERAKAVLEDFGGGELAEINRPKLKPLPPGVIP